MVGVIMECRKPLRLKNYDYSSQGSYYITICTKNRKNLFWQNGVPSSRRDNPCGCPLEYSHLGIIADRTIPIIENKYSVVIDKYVIMPNHIHMLIQFPKWAGASPAPTLSQVIGAYKSLVANQWLQVCKDNQTKMGAIWQRSFFEEIIRNESHYLHVWNYIDTNPYRWSEDEYFLED